MSGSVESAGLKCYVGARGGVTSCRRKYTVFLHVFFRAGRGESGTKLFAFGRPEKFLMLKKVIWRPKRGFSGKTAGGRNGLILLTYQYFITIFKVCIF
jgi:hypothetical protein